MSSPKQPKNKRKSGLQVLRLKAQKAFSGASAFTYHSFKVSKTFLPISVLLATDEKVTENELDVALDEFFESLYQHPLTQQTQKFTTYLRQNSLIPNEETTEHLIRYVINQSIARSPVPVPEAVISEFWNFFQELFSEPELKGLMELNLDIIRLVLRTYQPLLVELINLTKEIRRINQIKLNDLMTRVRVIQGDLKIIRRQIKAIRYIKPFFQTDPKDFKAQAQIIAQMVQEFGPFFIKIAQVAATNADFLPQEIAKELKVFQQDVPPMSAEEVMDAFAESLGKSPYECYFGFDPHKPLKSGSIGSVYVAKKPAIVDGEEVLLPVLIKVGRQNLDREFLMGRLVLGLAILSSQYWAPHSKLAPFLQAMQKQVEEFSKGFLQELDFEHEAKIQQDFQQKSQESTQWRVPEVYYSSHRILEMEYLPDVVMISQAIPKYAKEDQKRHFQRQLSERFLYTMMVHMVVYQQFHGDLHPGNIMVNQKAQLFLIDWGNSVDMKGKWKPVWDYVMAALVADTSLLADALIQISTHPEQNRMRKSEIEQTLEETLLKKRVLPLNRNFAIQLQQEGWEGIEKRIQVILHLVSNTQQLGLVVKSEYLHLSRSLFAMSGTYASLYANSSNWLMMMDFFTTLTQFPLLLMKDRFEVKRTQLRKTIIDKLKWKHWFQSEKSSSLSPTNVVNVS